MKIDFSTYTVPELLEVADRLKQEDDPDNYHQLQNALQHRRAEIEAYGQQRANRDEIILKAVAWWQIVGGAMLAYAGYERISLWLVSWSWLTLIAVLMLYSMAVLSVVAGIKLLKNQPSGVRLTYINQCLQLPYFVLFSVLYQSYMLWGGFFYVTSSLFVGFEFTGFFASFYLYQTELYGTTLGINLVPLLILLLVRRASGPKVLS